MLNMNMGLILQLLQPPAFIAAILIYHFTFLLFTTHQQVAFNLRCRYAFSSSKAYLNDQAFTVR